MYQYSVYGVFNLNASVKTWSYQFSPDCTSLSVSLRAAALYVYVRCVAMEGI